MSLQQQVAWCMALCVVGGVAIADDFQITRLQQDVLELQNQVRQQERRIESLERELAQWRALEPTAARGAGTPGVISSRAAPGPANWINVANWRRIKPGMSELEVVQLLGTPTSLRNSADGLQKILFYTQEIGSSGFLTGTVTVSKGAVVESQVPILKVSP